MPNQNDIRQAITNQIIAPLESGSVPPWRRPWKLGKNAGAHCQRHLQAKLQGLEPHPVGPRQREARILKPNGGERSINGRASAAE